MTDDSTKQSSEIDLLIIGGGINGVGIAADAAGRGLNVALCEMNDLASGTSSASSNLIHGGLRYLEQYNFSLVRQSLKERELLMKNAPHLVKALPFVLPHCSALRSSWLIRLGLIAYDCLSLDSSLPNSKHLSQQQLNDLGIQPQFHKGFKYYDCKTDDSRLVTHIALLAKQHGANILTRTKVIKIHEIDDEDNNYWKVTTIEQKTNQKRIIKTKAIINAAGPWVDVVAKDVLKIPLKYEMNLVKGSHIIVPKLYDHNHAFILQHRDQRIIFVIPYYDNFHLIGTTEIILNNLSEETSISEKEEDYLCGIANAFLQNNFSKDDIIHSYCGVRALYSEISENFNNQFSNVAYSLARDYVIDEYKSKSNLPILSIFSGKLTTYRSLAENVVNKLKPFFPSLKPNWTDKAKLPGSDFPKGNIDNLRKTIKDKYQWLPETLLQHLSNNYGSRAIQLIGDSNSMSDLGQYFGGNLYEREVKFLVDNEWAQTAEDILWRRGKQGLLLTEEEKENLNEYLN